jgi:hypothetical protein
MVPLPGYAGQTQTRRHRLAMDEAQRQRLRQSAARRYE